MVAQNTVRTCGVVVLGNSLGKPKKKFSGRTIFFGGGDKGFFAAYLIFFGCLH